MGRLIFVSTNFVLNDFETFSYRFDTLSFLIFGVDFFEAFGSDEIFKFKHKSSHIFNVVIFFFKRIRGHAAWILGKNQKN